MTPTSHPAPYPNIVRACLEVAYDNGGVHRYRSEKRVRREIEDFLAARPYSDHFAAIDIFLGGLDSEQLETVCAGEDIDMKALLTSAPPFTDQLLEEYFEEVC